MNNSTCQKGFTLIEIMIVVAIIAIIAAIAYPSYQDSVMKSRRALAKQALLETSQTLERCFTELGAYNDNGCSVVAGGAVNITDTEGYYTIASTTLTTTNFALSATPTAKGNQNADTHCATFTINHTGARTATNTDCW